MKDFDGYKLLRSIFLLLAIISMVIALFSRVSAQGVPSYVKDYSDQVLLPYLSSQSQIDIYNDCLQNYPFFVVLKDTSQYFSDGSYLFIFSSQQFLIFPNGYPSGTYNYSGIPTRNGNKGWGSIGTTGSYTSADLIVFNLTKNNNSIKNIFNVNYSFSAGSSSRFSTGYTITNLFGSYSAGSYDALISTTDYSLSSFVGNGTFYTRGNFSLTASDLYSSIYDDNFEIYKTYGNGGINDPILHIGYSQVSSSGYPYNSYTSYTLTFDVDGSRIPVTVTSNGSYSEYFIDTSLNAPMEFIYRLLNNGMFNFATSNSVKLVSVSMSATFYPTTDFNVGTPETYTKSTLCDLVLKGSSGSQLDYDSQDKSDALNITTVYNRVVDGSDWIQSSSSPSIPPNWASWATLYIVHGSGLMGIHNDQDTEYAFLYDDGLLYHNSNSIASDVDAVSVIDMLTDQFDVLTVFVGSYYLVDGVPTSWTASESIMYYGSRYFQRLGVYAQNDIQSAIEGQSQFLKAFFEMVYQYSNDIDSMLYSNLGSFGGLLASINTSGIDILSLLRQLLDRLASLHLMQLDVIESDLQTIISRIGQSGSGGGSSLDQDIYQAYKDWLYDINRSDSSISPHEFAQDVFPNISRLGQYLGLGFDSNFTVNKVFSYFQDFLDGALLAPGTSNYFKGYKDPSFDIHSQTGGY